MAKRISQLTQITAAQLATTDLVPVVDVSAGQTKYATIKDLTGSPDNGWQATGESWSFSSWVAASFTGVVTVPSDATLKYNAGMWVRFSQTTGGTKYGRILSVTATAITLWMPGYTLTNETITSPVYSGLRVPVGLPATLADGNPYRFDAYASATQSLSSNIKAPLNTENEDGAGIFDNSLYRMTAPVAGTYHFDLQAFMGSAGMGTTEACIIYLYKNGAEYTRSVQLNGSGDSWRTNRPTISRNVKLAAGDYVEMYTQMIGSRDLVGGNNNTFMTGHIVSR